MIGGQAIAIFRLLRQLGFAASVRIAQKLEGRNLGEYNESARHERQKRCGHDEPDHAAFGASHATPLPHVGWISPVRRTAAARDYSGARVLHPFQNSLCNVR